MSSFVAQALNRPGRADARRNYDALIEAARSVFGAGSTDAPLEDIARKAGVGIATLYRNFPTRDALIEAVYLEEVDAVVRAADAGAALPPWEALTGWLGRLVEYIGTKRALMQGLSQAPTSFRRCREELYGAGAPLLERAQAAGQVRPDISIDDVMKLVTGLAAANVTDAGQRDRLMSVAIAGLRA